MMKTRPSPSAPLQAGLEPYPGYRLCQLLGRGGFAERSQHFGQVVAIDVLGEPAERFPAWPQRPEIEHLGGGPGLLVAVLIDDTDEVIGFVLLRCHRCFPNLALVLLTAVGAVAVGLHGIKVVRGDASGLFLHLNTNKKSVTLDIATATGRQLLKRLLHQADVLDTGGVEEYRKVFGRDPK